MKTEIVKFSAHQNAKVFAILMAASVAVFLIPMAVILTVAGAFTHHDGNRDAFPVFMFIVMPFVYLIAGYLMTLLMLWFYNLLAPRIGGIQYETKETTEGTHNQAL